MHRIVREFDADRLRETAPMVAVAALAGFAGTMGSYALAGTTPGFVAAPISAFLARTLPGFVLTAAITLLGSLGQQLNLLAAIGLATAGFAVVAGVGTWVGRRLGLPVPGAGLAASASGLLSVSLTGEPLPALGSAVGVGVVLLAGTHARSTEDPAVDAGRRNALAALAGAIAVGVLGVGARATGVGSRFGGRTDSSGGSGGAGGSPPASEDVRALLQEASEKSLDVEGMEPLVSEEFYEVDIAAVNPNLLAEDWTLSFTGEVAEGKTVDYETLTSMEPEQRFVTLRCVGETLNGQKMDNALWTGVPIAPLLSDLEIQSGCGCARLHAADDYYQVFPLAALERGFLAWGMNGPDLPRRHGYPVRVLIPGHWGEINVKWLTEVEFLDREADGFWEERGWHGTGPVNTVAKLWAVNHLEGGRIQVGGHAYAGIRGVDAVEVSVDGGNTWAQAALSEPLPGEDVWRQWVYEYDSPGAPHEVVVRAVDGTGEVQSAEQSPAFPNGASGWVRQRVQG